VSITLTSGQQTATQRHALAGVVYLLSGTLGSISGSSAATAFKWSNRTFSGALGEFEEYLTLPQTIERALGPNLGDPAPIHPIRIGVRNKLWKDGRPLLAHLVDGTFTWEGSRADLRVAYLQPGQDPSELVSGDFTPLVSGGRLGSPQDVSLDAMTLVLNPPQEKLVGLVKLPRAQVSGASGTSMRCNFLLDPRDEGKPVPIVVGAPYQWMPTLRVGGAAWGYLVSGHASGATTVRIGNLVRNRPTAQQNSWKATLAGNEVAVYRNYALNCTAAAFAGDDNEYIDLTVDALPWDVPAGGVVQGFGGAAHIACSNPWEDTGAIEAAWLTADGRIIPTDPDLSWETLQSPSGPYYGVGTSLNCGNINGNFSRGIRTHWLVEKEVQVSGTTISGAAVTQQPAFTQSKSATFKNYPTGGSSDGSGPNTTNGANSESDAFSARDGEDGTWHAISGSNGASDVCTLTFPSVSTFDSDFLDSDTTKSYLYVQCSGNYITTSGRVTAGDFDQYFAVPYGLLATFRFDCSADNVDFDQSVTLRVHEDGVTDRFLRICEVWWEHTLQTTVSSALTVSAAVAGGSGSVPAQTLPDRIVGDSRLVWRPKKCSGNAIPKYADLGTKNITQVQLASNPWSYIDPNAPGAHVPTVPAVYASLLGMLFNRVVASGHIASGTYDAASGDLASAVPGHVEPFRCNFAIVEDFDWDTFQSALAFQMRCHAFEGVSGHELHFLDTASGYDAGSAEYTFKLPGVPDSNCVQAGPVLLERLPAAELWNTLEVDYERAYVGTNAGRYTQRQKVTNAASISGIGEKYHPGGVQEFFAWGQTLKPDDTYWSALSGVSGVAQWWVDRQAPGGLRFVFDTGWVAYGLDRGSIVRVAFPVGFDLYRNVLCEVEDIQFSPINAERVTLTCRSVGAVQEGIDPDDADAVWTDEFITDAQTWGSVFGPADVWTDDFETE
jgi:hypothetical protein